MLIIKDLSACQEIDMSAVRGGGIVLTGRGTDYSSDDIAPAAPTMADLWNQMFGGIAPV
jgi:hypothetical protein